LGYHMRLLALLAAWPAAMAKGPGALHEAPSCSDECRPGRANDTDCVSRAPGAAAQLRGAAARAARGRSYCESPAPPADADAVVLALPEGWEEALLHESNSTAQEEDQDWDDAGVAQRGYGTDVADVSSADGASTGGAVESPRTYCPAHPWTSNCYLYKICRGHTYCVVGGYMIVVGAPVAGMESINLANARSFDYLFTLAREHCSDTHCVLITNPNHFRTQDQLHIHFRHYNVGGSYLKHRLERAVCGRSGWQAFTECGGAKARIFQHFPGVFSTVAVAYSGNLGPVGITVWFTAACGNGIQTIVLATTHCSIEHSISAR